MSDAEKTESTFITDHLIESFNWLLSPRRQEILNSFNQALMRLYANIGKTCIAYLETENFKTTDEGLEGISKELVKRYGEIFDISQLKLMMLLAPHHDLPNSRASLFYALNWDMTSVLLTITDAKEQEFYLRAAVADNWSLSELIENVNQGTYQNTTLYKTLRNRLARYAISSDKQKNQLERQLKIAPLLDDYLKRHYANPFVEPLLTRYKPLLQPQHHEPAYTHKQFKHALKLKSADGIIAQIIGFRRDVSEHINSQFNETYRIAGEVLNSNKHHHPASFTELLNYVKKQYSYLFNDDDIETAMELNSERKNFDDMLYIMSLISWPHIKLLLPVKDFNAKLFYAEMAYQEDLSLQQLSKQIKANVYAEVSNEADDDRLPEKFTDVDQKNFLAQSYHQETLTGNSKTVKVRTIYMHQDDVRPTHAHLNLLQNPYFMQFMASPLP